MLTRLEILVKRETKQQTELFQGGSMFNGYFTDLFSPSNKITLIITLIT